MNKQSRSSRFALAAVAALSLAAFAAPASAAATFIGFEDFGNVGSSGPAVTTQYSGVTFSSAGGQFNQVSSQPNIGDGLNFICTGTGSINCTGETILTFATGVSNLSFLAVGSNASGTQALVDVFVNNALASTVNVNVGGIFNTPDLVNLNSFSNVTSIRIHGITDPGGLGWDDFSFTASAVPEPANVALMLAGLGLLAGARRKLRR